ncbi:TetR/AcrR family transcriptional regulator [Paenibacillus zeisoli]|uniref:TetR/AcrR family transcriptional regulator n=1 Tax=Paenibacillus zeisoli TaxID=2496267 RepID=A0A3S1DB08_9BACL|nr:TetR/AcrR family transcriptional regulator [Paenibacillus zeisoli]RUT33381.1 TetR/AcrR family transcriptional regulator [Paenibacillus zeisoli]
MPRSKEDNQKIREERIKGIRHATIRVYASKGFLGTQMDDIAKEAGLAKGLLYYYFKSKIELFQYVFNSLMDEAFQFSQAHTSEERNLEQSLEAFIHFFLSSAFERPVYPLVYKMLPEDLSHVFPDNAQEMQQAFHNRFNRPMIERFRSAMDRGEIPEGNPMLQALLFTSGVLTISHLIASRPSITDGKDQEQVIEEMKQQLFHGIFGRRNRSE